MQTHWDNYLTLSIVHFMAFPETIGGEGPIVETVTRIAEDDFFGAIEIGWIKDDAVRAQVRSVLEQSHLQVGYGGQSALLLQKLNLNSLVEEERRAAMAQMKACMDEAVEVGARRMAFLSGPDPGDAHRQRTFDLLVESVREMCAYARQAGLEGLTLETFDRQVDKKALIGPSDDAARLAAVIRQEYPEFGLMYDLSHMPLLNEEPEQALGLIKDYLVHVHVGNCVKTPGAEGYGDLHPRFGFPGGENDVEQLAEFIRALFKIGYLKDVGAGGSARPEERPWVGFEVKPWAGESSELVIAGAKRVWKQAWARV